jgi:hypothetical protein
MQQGYNFGLPSAARPYQISGGNFGNASMQSSIEYYDPVKDANAPIAGPAEEPAKKAGLAKFKDAALRGVNYDIDKVRTYRHTCLQTYYRMPQIHMHT